MSDRLLTIAGGLLAFLLVVILLVPVQRDQSAQVSRPLTTDRGRAGLAGLKTWLDRGGVQTRMLRRRYTALASDLELNPRGNLLIVSLPQHTRARSAELEALRSWLFQGNSALVLVAAGDLPRWSMNHGSGGSYEFLESLGFELDIRSPDEATHADRVREDPHAGNRASSGPSLETWITGEPLRLQPLFDHPLTRGVTAVSVRSQPRLDRGWYLEGVDSGRVVLPLLGAREQGAAFWEARVGGGRLWLSRYSSLFANVGLGEADNARLMANLIRLSLKPGGRVIFDEMHQGVSDLYDPKAFFSDPRFFNTLMFMAGFWLLYLVGRSRRLGPAREVVARYYAADLARAMAGFFARRLSAVVVQRQLFVFFFNDIRSRYGLPTNGEPVWTMLSGMPRVPAGDIAELQARYERAMAGTRPDLVASARLMQRTRKRLL